MSFNIQILMFSVIALLALYAIVLCVQLWKVKRIEAVKTVEEQQWVDNQKKETKGKQEKTKQQQQKKDRVNQNKSKL